MSNIVGPPLYYAVKHNHLEAARLLLEHGANSRSVSFNIKSIRGCTYIIVTAIKNHNAEMTDLLFDYGASCDTIHLTDMLMDRNVDMVECILRRWNYAYNILPIMSYAPRSSITRMESAKYILNAVKTHPFCLKVSI